MLKTNILSVKIFSFALLLLLMFMVSGFLLHYPVAIAAEPEATAGSGSAAQIGILARRRGPGYRYKITGLFRGPIDD